MFVLLLKLFPVMVSADGVNLEQHFVHFTPFHPSDMDNVYATTPKLANY